MAQKKQVVCMVGGAFAEAAARFVEGLAEALADRFEFRAYEGGEAFRHLAHCDLLVLGGLHTPTASGGSYEPLRRESKQLFGTFVSIGLPLLVAPEGAASFPDWPRYGELVGYAVEWEAESGEERAAEWLEIRAHPDGFWRDYEGMRLCAQGLSRAVMRPGMVGEVVARGVAPSGESRALVMRASGGPRPGAGTTFYVGLGPVHLESLGQELVVDFWRRALMWAAGESEPLSVGSL